MAESTKVLATSQKAKRRIQKQQNDESFNREVLEMNVNWIKYCGYLSTIILIQSILQVLTALFK